jgi:hypothetical protein
MFTVFRVAITAQEPVGLVVNASTETDAFIRIHEWLKERGFMDTIDHRPAIKLTKFDSKSSGEISAHIYNKGHYMKLQSARNCAKVFTNTVEVLR